MTEGLSGFEAKLDAATRRAILDLRRQLDEQQAAIDALEITIPWSAWTALTPINTWNNTAAAQPLEYRYRGTDVEVRLAVTGTTATVAFVLPSGRRPAIATRRSLDGAGAYAFAAIATNGNVTLFGTSSISGEFGFSTL